MKKAAGEVVDQHEIGNAGELHQIAGGTHPPMTTQHGVVVSDDENSLKAGERGPALMEDSCAAREDAALRS